MKPTYKSGAVAAVPPASGSQSEGNPTEGDMGASIPATVIGARWFYELAEEAKALIEDGVDGNGNAMVPDGAVLTQIRDAMRSKYAPKAALDVPDPVSGVGDLTAAQFRAVLNGILPLDRRVRIDGEIGFEEASFSSFSVIEFTTINALRSEAKITLLVRDAARTIRGGNTRATLSEPEYTASILSLLEVSDAGFRLQEIWASYGTEVLSPWVSWKGGKVKGYYLYGSS